MTRTHNPAGPLIWTLGLALTCLLLFLFQKALWLVLPVLFALIAYYLLLPLKRRLLLAGVSHDGAAALVGTAIFALLALLLGLVSPALAQLADAVQEGGMRYLDGGLRLLDTALRWLENRFAFAARAGLATEAATQVASLREGLAARHLADAALTAAVWLPSVLLVPFIAFFMLRDGWRFRRFLANAVPNAFFERTLLLLDRLDRTARLYFQGLIRLTVLDALCLALGLWIIGLSSPLLLGVLTAVLAWIPYVGSIAGCLLVVLVAATDYPGNPSIALAAIALFIGVRLLDDFVFMPMTIGRSLRMHPLLTVLMIFAGGAVAGVTGLVLVLPLLASVMAVGETVGAVLADPRLRARHRHALALRQAAVTRDLPPPA
jgi:predicted PurR-regulated permease PerM